MTKCSHKYAEWIAPGNSMEHNFDSHLRIKARHYKLKFPYNIIIFV